MIMISNFLFNIINLCIIICLFTKLLTLGILFSTAVNSELVARTVILGNLPSISITLVLKSVFLTKLLTSGIFLSTLLILSSYLVFLTKFVVSILSTFVTSLLYSVFIQHDFLLHYLT